MTIIKVRILRLEKSVKIVSTYLVILSLFDMELYNLSKQHIDESWLRNKLRTQKKFRTWSGSGTSD